MTRDNLEDPMTASLWYPGATRREIPAGANDPQIMPVMFVVHRSASRGPSLHDWFAHGSGGIEAHGYTTRAGASEQYRDFYTEADAQSDGNSWLAAGRRLGAISWENEGTAADEWTPPQLAELGRVLTFVHDHVGIPLVVVDSPHPTSLAAGGVGWHSKYPSWNPGVHNCPGDANVATLRALLPTLGRPMRPPGTPPVLRKGSDHPAWARYLKQLLNARGAQLDAASGVMDPATLDRLARFNRRHRIWPATAVAWRRTWRQLGVHL